MAAKVVLWDGGDDGSLLADDNGGLLICGDDGNLPPQGEPHGGPIRSDCGGLGSGDLTVISVRKIESLSRAPWHGRARAEHGAGATPEVAR